MILLNKENIKGGEVKKINQKKIKSKRPRRKSNYNLENQTRRLKEKRKNERDRIKYPLIELKYKVEKIM